MRFRGERGIEKKFFAEKIKEVQEKEGEKFEWPEPEKTTKGILLDEAIGAIEETNSEGYEKWFRKEKWKIKKAGYDWKSKEEGYIRMVAKELGADEDLMTKKKYGKYREEMARLIAIRDGIGEKDKKGEFVPKESTDLDDWYLGLNFLHKWTEDKDLVFTAEDRERINELRQKERKPEEGLSEKEEKELENLERKKEIFVAETDLMKAITGRNLGQEATKYKRVTEGLKKKLLSTQKDYENEKGNVDSLESQIDEKKENINWLKDTLSRYKQWIKEKEDEIEELRKGFERDENKLLREKEEIKNASEKPGISDEEKKELQKRFDEISDAISGLKDRQEQQEQKGGEIYNREKNAEGYKKQIEIANQELETAKTKLDTLKGQVNKGKKSMKDFENRIKELEEEIEKRPDWYGFIENEIKKEAKFLEKGFPEKRIKTFYARKKEKVANEALKTEVMPKTEEERTKIEETLDKEGITISDLVSMATEPKVAKKIRKNPTEGIKRFCKDNNLPYDSKSYPEYEKKVAENIGLPVGEVIKSDKGIVALLLGFIQYLILGEQKKEEQLGRFFEGLKLE